ncbi:unnamed protein product [Closterium sp. NIES-54]
MRVLLSDTVGFISDLPHQLVEAFHATLEEVVEADLLLVRGRRVLLSDTVGFISDLPHQLVEAFHATLEEVVEADLLLVGLVCNERATRTMYVVWAHAACAMNGLVEAFHATLEEVVEADLLLVGSFSDPPMPAQC